MLPRLRCVMMEQQIGEQRLSPGGARQRKPLLAKSEIYGPEQPRAQSRIHHLSLRLPPVPELPGRLRSGERSRNGRPLILSA
jgi:hypothetical protein